MLNLFREQHNVVGKKSGVGWLVRSVLLSNYMLAFLQVKSMYNLRSFYMLGQKDKINWKNTPRLAKLDKDIDAHM